MTPIRAQMAQRPEGNWCVYVAVVPGRVSEWPDYDWPKSHRSIPTIGERDKALKRLGYRRPSDAAAWEWQETEGLNGRVKLFASIEVTPE